MVACMPPLLTAHIFPTASPSCNQIMLIKSSRAAGKPPPSFPAIYGTWLLVGGQHPQDFQEHLPLL